MVIKMKGSSFMGTENDFLLKEVIEVFQSVDENLLIVNDGNREIIFAPNTIDAKTCISDILFEKHSADLSG